MCKLFAIGQTTNLVWPFSIFEKKVLDFYSLFSARKTFSSPRVKFTFVLSVLSKLLKNCVDENNLDLVRFSLGWNFSKASIHKAIVCSSCRKWNLEMTEKRHYFKSLFESVANKFRVIAAESISKNAISLRFENSKFSST